MPEDPARRAILWAVEVKEVSNLTVTERAAEILRLEAAKLVAGRVLALHFMVSFTNRDGTAVVGFVPGYTVDRVDDGPFGDNWLMVRLPQIGGVHFMPKFEWRADQSYVLDQASAYTLSVLPADPARLHKPE